MDDVFEARFYELGNLSALYCLLYRNELWEDEKCTACGCVGMCKYLRYGSRWVFILMCIILSFAEISQELIGVLF